MSRTGVHVCPKYYILERIRTKWSGQGPWRQGCYRPSHHDARSGAGVGSQWLRRAFAKVVSPPVQEAACHQHIMKVRKFAALGNAL